MDTRPAAGGTDEARLTVRVLGSPVLRDASGERPFPPGRPGRLLAALLLARGRPVGVDRLVDDVWGDQPPSGARAALHTTVARLRRALGPAEGLLERVAGGYRLDRSGVVVDAEEFLDVVSRARELSGGQALERYGEALRLWQGQPWAPWADGLAQADALHLADMRATAREAVARLLLDQGRTAEALGDLRLLVAEHPLRDGPVRLLMEGLDRAGDAAEALRVFAHHRRAMAEELGLDPAPDLVALQERVLRREAHHPSRRNDRAVAVPPPIPPPGPAPTPETPPPDAPPRARLLGRDAELERVARLTAMHRCVTVVGPGGVGKTTLARGVAAALGSHGPTWWVDLTSLTTGTELRALVATALDVRVFPGGSPQAALRRRLETATGLLVLDNCEHVLAAATDLVDEMVRAGEGLRVLATSRERLGLTEEQVYPLPPLRLPAPDTVNSDEPAVALFLERALAADPTLAVDEDTLREVAEVVRLLDGLPLAIELAASRVGVLSLTSLRQHLDSRIDVLKGHRRRGPARHRTLAGTIEWSYELLDEKERQAFRRLSVFAGPFDLDAAEAILGPDALEAVLALVERSLVVRPGPHADADYRMLATLRAFARSRLSDAEEEELAATHASWAAELAASVQERMAGPDEAEAHRLVLARLPDFIQALSWSVNNGEVASAARIVEGLYEWAYYRVRMDVLAWALPLVASGDARAITPGVRAAASSYWWMAGDQEQARTQAELGIAEAGGPGSAASSLPTIAAADTALAVGELDHARRVILEVVDNGVMTPAHELIGVAGLALADSFGGRPVGTSVDRVRRLEGVVRNPSALAMGEYSLGEALSDHEPATALVHFARARRLAEEVGNRLALGVSMAAETALRGRAGSLDAETLTHSIAAVEFWLGSGNENLFATCLRNVVSLLDRLDEHELAVAVLASTTEHTLDRPPYGAEAERLEVALAHARATLGDAAAEAAWSAGSGQSLEQAALRVVGALRRHV